VAPPLAWVSAAGGLSFVKAGILHADPLRADRRPGRGPRGTSKWIKVG
jgi:hypothetical protein